MSLHNKKLLLEWHTKHEVGAERNEVSGCWSGEGSLNSRELQERGKN